MRVLAMLMATGTGNSGILSDQALVADATRFDVELAKAGVLLVGERLHQPASGIRVSLANGRRVAVERPVVPVPEHVAGFWLWQVRTMDEAVEWARRSPSLNEGRAEIEIRQVISPE